MQINDIQDYLVKHDLDGWLMADFHGRNTIAVQFLGLSGIVTRRSFYFIPAAGDPVALVHAIEKDKFRDVPGQIRTYSSYRHLEDQLTNIVRPVDRVAMEYSPMGRLPYVGLVDAGTIELVRDMGVEIVSSADLVARFQARLSAEQIAAHRMAARNVIDVKEDAFAHVAAAIKDGRTLTEHDICRFILERFAALDMETASGPICAIDSHAGDPHYEPPETGSTEIAEGQLILIDLWARLKHAWGVYADITWVGYTGSRDDVPEKHARTFEIAAQARDKAVKFLRDNSETRPVCGYEVDNVCREVINAAGMGDHFTHRTGHSITSSEHGTGPNIDNLETEDRRKLQKGHLFSIEPGIYLPDYGVRTEINVLMGHDGVEVTTLPIQEEIKPLL